MKTPLLACLAIAALNLSACGQSKDPLFDAKVRAYLLAHPEVLEEAFAKLEEKRASEAAVTTQAAVETHRAAIERDPRDFVANPAGRITVTEFFDYRCTYCRVVAPEVMKLISDNPDVRFVFKELPVLSKESHQAAGAALAAGEQSKYLALHNRFYATSNLDAAAIDREVAAAGFDPAVIKARANSPEIQRHLLDNSALASALGINGTPTFIIADKVVIGGDIAAIRAAIESQRKAG